MVSVAPAVELLKSDLWNHQHEYVTKHALDREHILLWEPRLGKTRASIEGMVRWVGERQVRRIIVVAPQTVAADVWAPSLQEYRAQGFFGRPESVVIHELYAGSLEARSGVLRAHRATEGVQIVVTNRDALKPLQAAFLRWKPEGLILDELHDYTRPSTDRGTAAYYIGRVCRFRRGLTGTPLPNGLHNIYGQWKIVSPATFGTSRATFDERYVSYHPKFKSRVVAYHNQEELQRRAFAIASIVFRKDCFDVPDEQDVPRELVLPDHARKVYDQVKNYHILELENAERQNIKVPMPHLLSRIQELRSIAIGYARHGEGDDRKLDWLYKDKLELVRDEATDIMESGKKVVIFHAFTPEGEEMVRMLKGYNPLVLRGATSSEDRVQNIERFRSEDDYPVIVVQEQVGSLGISLAAADYTIFLSTGLSHAVHKQARDRTFKPVHDGQKLSLVYVYPTVKNTVEVGIRALLQKKASLEAAVLKGGQAKSFRALAEGKMPFMFS